MSKINARLEGNIDIRLWQDVPSESEEGKTYTITAFHPVYREDICSLGSVKCNCPAFTYGPGDCKHIKTFLSQFQSVYELKEEEQSCNVQNVEKISQESQEEQ